ncbi:MAG: hypothetical protein J0H65_14915 [Rhizobiales bacterium]|nr:hypothetical protein [Hyphomicrobiales bacterium]
MNSDSRSFSRILCFAHALVLREATDLAARALVTVRDRNERTQRTSLALTEHGRRLFAPVSH